MSLDPLSNPLSSVGVLPYGQNLRSQTAVTNNVNWSATTQYFINDMVRSPLDGGMYVYEAWSGVANTPTCRVGGSDPSTAAGKTAGWSSTQGNGLKTVQQTAAAVTGTALGAAGALGGTAGLTLTIPSPTLVGASVWLVKLDYVTGLTGVATFGATEWVAWTVTPNGTAPAARQCNHVFGAGATSSGSPVSFIVNAPADATTLTVTGVQSATSVVLLPGTVIATFARLS